MPDVVEDNVDRRRETPARVKTTVLKDKYMILHAVNGF